MSIISGIANSKEAFDLVSTKLTSDDFTFSVCGKIYEYLHSYINDNEDFYETINENTNIDIAIEIFHLYNIRIETTIKLLDTESSKTLEVDLVELEDFINYKRSIIGNEVPERFTNFEIEDEFGVYYVVFVNGFIYQIHTTYVFHLPKDLCDTFDKTFEQYQSYINKENYEVTAEINDKEEIEAFCLKKNLDKIDKIDKLIKWIEENNLDHSKFPRNRGALLDLRLIDLDNQNLEIIPNELFEIKKNSIFVSMLNNRLTEIPKNINLLKTCYALMFCKNEITELPNELFELISLNTLCLHGNKLTVLPNDISKMEGLYHLSISNNNIEILPLSISKLKNLSELDIENTLISEESLFHINLGQIKKISFDDRLLPFFLKNIHKLKNINSINLVHSNYKKTDPSIKKLNLQFDTKEWMDEKDYLGHGCIRLKVTN